MSPRRLAPLAALVAALGCTMVSADVALAAGSQAGETAGQKLDDGVITTKVKLALAQDKQVKARDIAVSTSEGTVQLSGNADDHAQAARAEELAKQIRGVKDVKNDIQIKSRQ